jgi:deazaflavin-dependent oxidoreductase (nitroreductase family)
VHPLTKLAHRLGRYPWVMKLAPVILAVDRALHRLTGGRVSVLSLARMPSLRLVTTGRKTGLPRANDLLYTPYDGWYVLIGSGWGRPTHPAWTANLMANPEATIIVRGRAIPVVARRAEAQEVEDIWRAALRNWPGYEMEKRLAGGREFRIFLLARRA